MTRFQRSFPILCGVLLATGAGLGIWKLTSRPERGTSQDVDEPHLASDVRSFPSIPTGDLPIDPGQAPPPEATDARVARVMKDWRNAIIEKNPEVVEALDRMFAAQSATFIPALMASAEGDPEERVRSFSTRVLGKLRPPESAELMRKLLEDRSEYVRFNAAWATGELGDRQAAARLRQLQKRDPSANVRRSADASLRKMDGG